ncbi:MAG: DNA-binding domain-containing protein [Clostridia bacterium]|nr:DNA-binding domain-containing protein [Clostridia bacterium]
MMKFYLVDDDLMVIKILENIIEEQRLGDVIGYSTDSTECINEILIKKPNIVLVDMLMPQKDGSMLVSEIKSKNEEIKFIMISQITTKNLISKAYSAGIEFFINKPINKIEVTNVIQKLADTIKMEKKFKIIEEMFVSAGGNNGTTQKDQLYNIRHVFSKLGIMGEKGSEDVVKICEYMLRNNIKSFDFKVRDICEKLSDNPKAMEQRLRRAINKGLINIANVGIEDYMNETFMRYSNSIYDFENVKAEMDYIRGKRKTGGKISVKRFIDNLILMSEE